MESTSIKRSKCKEWAHELRIRNMQHYRFKSRSGGWGACTLVVPQSGNFPDRARALVVTLVLPVPAASAVPRAGSLFFCFFACFRCFACGALIAILFFCCRNSACGALVAILFFCFFACGVLIEILFFCFACGTLGAILFFCFFAISLLEFE